MLRMMMWLQVMMLAAAYGLSVVVPFQQVCPMDLFALSCCLVSAAVARKAVKTWAAWRQFGKVNNG